MVIPEDQVSGHRVELIGKAVETVLKTSGDGSSVDVGCFLSNADCGNMPWARTGTFEVEDVRERLAADVCMVQKAYPDGGDGIRV